MKNAMKNEMKNEMNAHVKKYGATAFSSPCSLIREREEIRGREEWGWAIENGEEGTPLGLTDKELHARMLEWSEEEGLEWNILPQCDRDALIVQMYLIVYVEELIERITAQWED